MTKKGPYEVKEIKTLAVGQQIWGKFLILECNSRKTKDGKEITNLRIGDSTGEVDVVVWESCNVSGKMESGALIGLLGDLGTYNNRLQITAKRVKTLDEDPIPYLKAPLVDTSSLLSEFEELITSISDPYLKELLERLFNPQMKDLFYKAPAARKIHHNYHGGLLEHTLTVARLCNMAAKIYPDINRDLLITGAILHDIGKIKEYYIKVTPEYTTAGRMMGHIVLGTEILSAEIVKMRLDNISFPEELEMMLKHMVLSHHGNLEYGSPVIPLFPEALLLHVADNLDAKMFVFFDKISEDAEGGELFTPYDAFFGQQYFKYRYQYENDAESQNNQPATPDEE
ncbi:MAG: HD domain-containing protein [Syntrophomonadaceae bacterium]|nr:HD domain-containing protein [Syntrophomonadaceae bacterium]MDD3888593.1 HD domain-containing protein [Syntrophomonadaceae bacterium]MDD4549152.1 HD domain-containing protein [Syntrophomonadaceae bacterium]